MKLFVGLLVIFFSCCVPLWAESQSLEEQEVYWMHDVVARYGNSIGYAGLRQGGKEIAEAVRKLALIELKLGRNDEARLFASIAKNVYSAYPGSETNGISTEWNSRYEDFWMRALADTIWSHGSKRDAATLYEHFYLNNNTMLSNFARSGRGLNTKCDDIGDSPTTGKEWLIEFIHVLNRLSQYYASIPGVEGAQAKSQQYANAAHHWLDTFHTTTDALNQR